MHQDRACSALRQPELQIQPPRYFKGFHRRSREVKHDRSREVKQEPSIAPPAPEMPSAEEVDLPAYIPSGMIKNVILLGTSSKIMQPQPSSTTKNGRRGEHEALPVDTSALTEGASDVTTVLIAREDACAHGSGIHLSERTEPSAGGHQQHGATRTKIAATPVEEPRVLS